MVNSLSGFLLPTRVKGLALRLMLFLVVATSLRVVLFFTHLDQLNYPYTQFLKGIITGVRFDVFVGLWVMLPYALSVLLLPSTSAPSRLRTGLRVAGNLIFLFGLLYLAVVEFFFFDEFNARLNFIAVDYLLYPHEVFLNIWASYPVGWAIFLTAAAALFLHQVSWPTLRNAWLAGLPGKQRGIWLCGYGLTIFAASITVSINSAQISTNRIANEIALNGIYSFSYSLLSNDVRYHDHYRSISESEAVARVRDQIGLPAENWLESDIVVGRHIPATGTPRPLNVVLILEESFGSEFSALLHPEQNAGVTPEFDAIAQDGLLYSHIYASGNRTARGLEATLTSFVPIPGQSIVKRPGSEGVFSLPALLKAKGYQTRFIYGGMGYFDNMSHFSLHNGFDTFIDQSDFTDAEISYTTIWGVCDEDLFNRSLREIDDLANKHQPFFTTILTVSNHKPYLYPAGRIIEDPKEQKRRYAVKYADFALGKFIQEARQKSWFENTLFVILGDHGARVYGEQEIPISSYEIPIVFYAPKHIAPDRDDSLGSQIDVAPTILGLLNIEYNSAFFGRDLRRIGDADRYAFFSHNHDVGLLKDNQLLVLGVQGNIHLWNVLNREGEMSLAAVDERSPLLRDTIAFYQTGYTLFSAGRWRPLPQESMVKQHSRQENTTVAVEE